MSLSNRECSNKASIACPLCGKGRHAQSSLHSLSLWLFRITGKHQDTDDIVHLKLTNWASLVAQWLGIRLPMQGTQVRALFREDPTYRGATGPMRHNCWARTLEPASHNYWGPCAWSPCSAAGEATAPQRRVGPAHCNWGRPTHSNEDPTQPKINKLIN